MLIVSSSLNSEILFGLPMNKALLILVSLFITAILLLPVSTSHPLHESKTYEVDICGKYEIESHLVYISSADGEKVDELLNSFISNIQVVKNSDEANAQYSQLINHLCASHLLNALSRDQVRNTSSSFDIDFRFKALRNDLNANFIEQKNLFCLIVGLTNNTEFIGPLGSLILLINGGDAFYNPSWIISAFNPFHIGSTIYLGGIGFSAHGAVWSLGVRGLKTWSDSFEGNLKNPPLWFQLPYPPGAPKTTYYPGVIGFSGLKIADWVRGRTFFVGSAIFADINQL